MQYVSLKIEGKSPEGGKLSALCPTLWTRFTITYQTTSIGDFQIYFISLVSSIRTGGFHRIYPEEWPASALHWSSLQRDQPHQLSQEAAPSPVIPPAPNRSHEVRCLVLLNHTTISTIADPRAYWVSVGACLFILPGLAIPKSCSHFQKLSQEEPGSSDWAEWADWNYENGWN